MALTKGSKGNKKDSHTEAMRRETRVRWPALTPMDWHWLLLPPETSLHVQHLWRGLMVLVGVSTGGQP